MAQEIDAVGLLNRLFETTTSSHDDARELTRDVEARIAALAAAERAAISLLLGRALAFCAPDNGRRRPH